MLRKPASGVARVVRMAEEILTDGVSDFVSACRGSRGEPEVALAAPGAF